MAKVKIQGNASGTGILTVTAPNTSTDRTITLPDGTGTLIADDGSGNVGIGTSSPEGKIEINDGSYAKMVLDVTGSKAFIQTSKWDGTNPGRDLVIQTKQSDGETARFLADGGITFNGDTTSANALNDYETGTWTPVFSGSSGAPSSSVYHTNPVGTYTKIGRQVTVTFYAHVNSLTGGGGSFYITGLPFTSMASGSGGYKGSVQFYFADDSTKSDPVLQLDASNSHMTILCSTGTDGSLGNNSWGALPLSAVDSATAMGGTITYFAI